MKRRVTIVEVARACGLATSTVSNALANKPYVLPDTKRIVVDAAQRLGYRASATARSLRLQRSWTISLVAGDIANSYYGEILTAVENEAWQRGYSLLLANTQFSDSKQFESIASMMDRQIDGLIMASHGLSGVDIELLRSRETPVVLLSRFDPKLDADKVGVDNLAGGRLAVEHLLAKGHRRIGFISGRRITSAAHERHHAYCDCLRQAGITVDEDIIVQGDYSEASGREAAARLLALRSPPTAIFCANDLMAIGAMAAAHNAGVGVPAELSLVGFDDIDIAGHPLIGLTTIHVPRAELGRVAASTLIDRIERKAGASRTIHLAPHLVSRNTVSPR